MNVGPRVSCGWNVSLVVECDHLVQRSLTMVLGDYLAAGVTGITGVHAYLWLRLVHGTTQARRVRIAGAVVLGSLALSVVVLLRGPWWLPAGLDRFLWRYGFGWIGLGLMLLCATLLTELPRLAFHVMALVGRLQRGAAPANPERRRVLGQVLGGTAAALGAGVAVVGADDVLALRVQRIRVPLARLPFTMNGTRIVQITDLHFGGSIGPEYLDRVIRETNALKPDVIVITGDLVDGRVEEQARHLARLSELTARHGVYFVTGNHEYYYGAAAWVDAITALGIRVLRNERVSIGTPEASFDLAGVDDWSAARYGIGHGQDLTRALSGRDPIRELVLLAHQPRTVHEAASLGVGLQLSGHTHGGQIFPFKFVMYLEQPFVDGLHRLRDTFIYVSPGTGYWGPAMRVGAPPEIAELTLVCSPGSGDSAHG